MGDLLGKFFFTFSTIMEHCEALTNSCLLEYATVFPIKNRFLPVTLSNFIPVLSKSRHCFNYLLSQEVHTNLQIKKISASETLIQEYRSSELQSNNIKKHPSQIYSF